jgi:hypothetical protein
MEEKVIVKSPVVRRSGPMSIVDETFAKRAPLVIFVAVAAALMIVSSARAAQFRQLPELPVIPPSITFSGERDFLQADLDRLKVRITAVEGKRATHHRDCGQRLMSNVTRKRQCSFLAQEIHRDSSRLRTAISSLRSRFGEIERNALQRRQSGASGVSGAGRAVREPVRDRRPKLMADALAAGDGSWKDLLAHVKSMMDRGAGDPAVRDVSAYLTGLYSGQMAADVLNDAYYKHGVRRALAGDHWSATLAFARAARDRPDDLRVFESFADAAGRQHAGPACIQSGRCVSGNVAQWAKQFGNKHEQALKKIIAAERKRKLSLNVAGTFRVLRAAAVYAAKKEAGEVAYPPAGDPGDELAPQALAAARSGDWAEAVRLYVRLWEKTEPGRAGVFLARYAQASGAATAKALLDGNAYPPTSSKSDREYLDVLRRAYAQGDDNSPFAGSLSQAQIIRLQR